MKPVDGYPVPYGLCNDMRLRGEKETADPFVALYDIYRGFRHYFECSSRINASPHAAASQTTFTKVMSDIAYFSPITFIDLAIAIAIAVGWTFCRTLIIKHFFTPIANWIGIFPENTKKYVESLFKGGSFLFLFLCSVYVSFFRGYDYFERPLQMFKGQNIGGNAELDLLIIYALECGFYLHSSYATVFMDTWRKDSVTMLVHHVIALCLIVFSRISGYLKIGVMIMLLDDVNDILLEFGKCITYMRHTRYGYSRICSLISNVLAVLFAVSWVVFRLYLYLTKVWRPALIGPWVSLAVVPAPFQFFLSVLLGAHYFFTLYWFYFIVLFIWRILRQSSKAEDPRESSGTETATATRKQKDSSSGNKSDNNAQDGVGHRGGHNHDD